MENIQEIFNECHSDILKLETGEYKGAFIIDRPCTVDGSMSTLWAENSTVLIVKSGGVTIKNLRIEVTGGENYAIETDFPDLKLINVEVKGDIRGLTSEPEKWELPYIISFGEFMSDVENSFVREIISATETEIISDIDGLKIQPSHLKKGKNSVEFTVSPMKDNTILYGEVFIKSLVTRRIYINGKAVKNAGERHEHSEEHHEKDFIYLLKGQRININDYSPMKFVLETKSNIDIDSYAFLLKSDNKVSCDEDLIFFGCPKSKDNAVETGKNGEQPFVSIDLEKLNPEYKKIAVCFAIYGNDLRLNFSHIKSPILHIFSGEDEIYRFKLEGLNIEKTVVAVEMYNYKDKWKINCIGSGYRNGLKQLCESYGVEIEN